MDSPEMGIPRTDMAARQKLLGVSCSGSMCILGLDHVDALP